MWLRRQTVPIDGMWSSRPDACFYQSTFRDSLMVGRRDTGHRGQGDVRHGSHFKDMHKNPNEHVATCMGPTPKLATRVPNPPIAPTLQRHPLCPQCGLSRASQLARRDALSLTVSAPRLSDFLSNSRSGDAADWQVACGSMLWQRRFVSSLELRRARPADGDTSAVCGPRASAMRPRRVAVGYRPRERSANDARYGCGTVYHHSGCGCESGSARP